MAFRAFVGVPVDDEPRLRAALDGLAATGADLKLVDPSRVHLTLAFLGDVPDDAPSTLAPALDAATAGAPAFDVQLRGVGAFPTAGKPRVVWAGVHDAPRLDALAQSTRDHLAQAGFPGDDKPFRAHATLARTRSPRGLDALVKFLAAHRDDHLGTHRVAGVRLYRSTLSPQGPRYDVMHEARLEG